MKRRVRGKSSRRPSVINTQEFSRLRLGVVIAFVLIGSTLYALRESALSSTPLIPLWIAAFLIFAFIGAIMLVSRITFAILGLAGIGYFLRDSVGFPLDFSSAVYWAIGALTAMFVTLSIAAGQIAPPFNQDAVSSSLLGFRLLLAEAFRELMKKRSFNIGPSELSESFRTIGAGRLESHQAITLQKGASHAGVQGPGYAMLPNGYGISEVVDLRKRMTTEKCDANTRDLVNIRASVSVTYHVRRPETHRNARVPYPYLNNAIREIHYSDAVYQGQHQIHAFKRVGGHASIIAAEKISERTLAEILDVGEPGQSAIAKIAREIQAKLAAEFRPFGIEISSVSLSNFVLPQEVTDTRFEQWKRNWDTSINAKKIGGGIRPLATESAEIQAKVVGELIENVRTITAASGYQRDHPVNRRLENLIHDIATEGFIRSLVPPAKEDK